MHLVQFPERALVSWTPLAPEPCAVTRIEDLRAELCIALVPCGSVSAILGQQGREEVGEASPEAHKQTLARKPPPVHGRLGVFGEPGQINCRTDV